MRCGQVAPHLFLWSFYYDAEKVQAHPHERERFAADFNERRCVGGATFTYHRRFYQAELAADPKYQGGLEDYANWLDLLELRKAVGLAGYEIVKVIDDEYMGMPAINIFAERREAERRGLRRWLEYKSTNGPSTARASHAPLGYIRGSSFDCACFARSAQVTYRGSSFDCACSHAPLRMTYRGTSFDCACFARSAQDDIQGLVLRLRVLRTLRSG